LLKGEEPFLFFVVEMIEKGAEAAGSAANQPGRDHASIICGQGVANRLALGRQQRY